MQTKTLINVRLWWRSVTIISCLLLFSLCFQIYNSASKDQITVINENNDSLKKLESITDIETHLSLWKEKSDELGVPMTTVPTGIFIQSIKFENSHEVNVTGYIWQKYTKGLHDGISRGFVLPESVDSSNAIEEIAFKKEYGETEVICWYFERILRQNFTYKKYPLDVKRVWVRFWHKDFYRNVALVPDISAYTSVGKTDIFGIDEDIVMAGWRLVDTNFVYQVRNYATRFGLEGDLWKSIYPELHYNLLLQRSIINPMIIDIGPIAVVLILLFAVLLLNSSQREKNENSGFTLMDAYAMLTGLFFVAILSHINFRENFPVDEIVYVEYYYLLIYSVLIFLTINFYLCRMQVKHPIFQFFFYGDNVLIKLLYWPTILGLLNLLTSQVL